MDELSVYRQEELTHHLMNLPGYARLGSLPDIIKLRSDWQPVLSLSVFRRNPKHHARIQALTGIRHNTSTHDGVVSTLTGAFPAGLQWALVQAKQPWLAGGYPGVRIGDNGPNARETAVVAKYNPNLDLAPSNQNVLPYLTHDIFARKLGLSNLISLRFGKDRHLGTVSLSHVAIGVSYVDNEESDDAPLWEPLVMYGAAFMLDDQYSDAIPTEVQRYKHLGWTNDIDSFSSDVNDRNVEKLAPYAPPLETVEFCARGMCLAMTSMLTSSDDIRPHLGL